MKHTLIISLIFALFSTFANAHPGHGLESAYAGFMHPLTGVDHLLVMLAIGLWAAKVGGTARWQLPLTFVLLMAVGASLGLEGFNLPVLETGIAASVMAMGLLLLMRLPMHRATQLSLVGLFALMHGMAHGVELASHSLWSAFGAMLIATSLLHVVGYWLGSQRVLLASQVQRVFAYSLMLVGTYLIIV